MNLLVEQLESDHVRVVSVAGFAKNCGKTTTLNHLIAGYAQRGVQLGITSMGRDGEPTDAVTQQPKPTITLPAGALFLTAEESLQSSHVQAQVITRTGLTSAMGELLLARMMEGGAIEVSGPTTARQARELVQLMQHEGCERVLLDGALDRRTSCCPAVCEAVVLAGGAVLGATAASAAARIAFGVSLFHLPQAAPEIRETIEKALGEEDFAAVLVDSLSQPTVLPGSALQQQEQLQLRVRERAVAQLYVGGALTDDIIEQMRPLRPQLEYIMADATRIFLSPLALGRLELMGGKVTVLHPIKVSAVTTNPHNPLGEDLDAEELCRVTSEALPELPVFDVVAGLCRSTGEASVCPQ